MQIKKGKRVWGGAKTLDGNGEIAIFGQAEEVVWGGEGGLHFSSLFSAPRC